MHRLKLVGSILGILLIAYLMFRFVGDVSSLWEFMLSMDAKYLILSFLLYTSGLLVATLSQKYMYEAFGVQLTFKRTFYIYLLSALGRYLPGKFIMFGITLFISRTLGLDLSRITKASILLQIIILIAVVPFLTLIFLGKLSSALVGFLTISLFFLVVFKRFFLPFLLVSASWMLMGTSFALFCKGSIHVQSISHAIAVYPVSHTLGLLSIITPAGIGVREGSIFLLMKEYVGEAEATLLGINFRILTTLSELILSSLAYLLYITDSSGSH